MTDVKGQGFIYKETVANLGDVRLRFVISDTSHRLRQPGISIRVGGKVVGKPSFFDVDKNHPEIPAKLFKKLYGEVEADELLDYVTADWGAVIENSKAYQALIHFVAPKIQKAIEDSFKHEISLAKARLQKQVDREFQKLPEHKRDYARRAFNKVVNTFWDLPESKVRMIISVVLDTIEKDEYWEVIRALEQAQHADVSTFADALHQFGLVELSMMYKQAAGRLNFLTKLQQLVDNRKTKEEEIHKAIETNLWILGPEYSIMSSNVTLKTVVRNITGKNEYSGDFTQHRPDLLLTQNILKHYLLIEFKRPAHTVVRRERGGLLHVFIQHASASLCLNENADPTVRQAFGQFFNRAAPENAPYFRHSSEGPADMPAHLKAAMLGSSMSIPVTAGWAPGKASTWASTATGALVLTRLDG